MNYKSNFVLNVDELVSDDPVLKLSALSNAARISICVLENSKNNGKTIEQSEESKLCVKDDEHNKHKVKININQSTEISTKQVVNYDDFNNFALMKTAEKQRRENVKKELEDRQQVISSQNDKQTELRNLSCLQARKANILRKNAEEMQILKEAEQIAAELAQENKKRFNFQRDEQQRRLEKLKKEQSIRQKRILCDEIFKFQIKFSESYEKIINQFKQLDKSIYASIEEDINNKLRQLIGVFNVLIHKIKSDDIDPNDLKIAENLSLEIEKLQIHFDTVIDAIKKESKLIEQKLEEESLKELPKIAEVPPQHVQTAAIVNETSHKHDDDQKTITNFVTPENYAFYNNIMAFYTSKVEGVKPLQADESMKKYRSNCQKAINIPVNAISAVNSQHLQDKYDKLYGLVSGSPIKTSDGVICAADHPLGRDFCLLLLAKKFVSQGDSTVSSNLQAAFPIAAIIVSIWQKIPDFGKLFLAYAFKECPYLVPYFIPQFNGQSIEDYYKLLGYRLTDGVLEKQDMYLKRQSGIIKLYAAIIVTKVRQTDGPNHPHGIENGWRWLNSLLNLDPLPDICATLVLGFLQIAGFEMWRVYGKQFTKVLRLIQQQYFTKLSKVDEGGPKSRLEVFLMNVIKDEKIEEPIGLLPPNFW